MRLLMVFFLLVGTISLSTNDAYAGRKERAAKRAGKQKKRADKACAKGKARKCERLNRKAAANEYAAQTGDFKGKRQMKRRDRKLRKAKKACRKGKQKKCDRLTRKAAKHDCLLKGGDRKGCRQAKRRMRKDQRAYRQGFSDKNVTENQMNRLNRQQGRQRNRLSRSTECKENGGQWISTGGIGRGHCDYGEGDEYGEGGQPLVGQNPNGWGQPIAAQPIQPVDNGFNARLMQLRQQKAMACEARGGSWTGTSCIEGRVPSGGFMGGAPPAMGGRRAPIGAPVQQYQGNQLMQQRGFGQPQQGYQGY